jgi:CHASE3 domain sensor protein
LKIASSLEITVREQAGLSSNRNYFNTERGKRIMDDIRKVSYNMDQLEENSLIARNKIAVDSYFLAQLYVVLGGIIYLLPLLMIINNQLKLKLKTSKIRGSINRSCLLNSNFS